MRFHALNIPILWQFKAFLNIVWYDVSPLNKFQHQTATKCNPWEPEPKPSTTKSLSSGPAVINKSSSSRHPLGYSAWPTSQEKVWRGMVSMDQYAAIWYWIVKYLSICIVFRPQSPLAWKLGSRPPRPCRDSRPWQPLLRTCGSFDTAHSNRMSKSILKRHFWFLNTLNGRMYVRFQ